LWHELALRLGGTVSDLKHRMSNAEFGRWINYRNRHGAMDDKRTSDRPAAVIASTIAQVFGGKATSEDFMPYKRKDDELPSRPEELMSVFGGLKPGKRKK
jgi:hypothetical protein